MKTLGTDASALKPSRPRRAVRRANPPGKRVIKGRGWVA